MKKIHLAKDFSYHPMGRNYKDGPDNGRRFYEEFLAELLEKNLKVIIILDGCNSLGSSFLDEAFYEMPKLNKYKKSYVQNLVKISATSPEYNFYKHMTEKFISKLPTR